jgi:hypothetical protein
LQAARIAGIVGVCGENAALTHDDIRQLRRDYVERVQVTRVVRVRAVTDKMPQNFLYLRLIARLFPEATVVHCTHDPMDNSMSVYFQNFTASAAHAYSFDLADLGDYYREYEGSMSHWLERLMQLVRAQSYEALVTDQEAESRALLVAVGLTWDDAVMHFHETRRDVQTASAAQLRTPMYSTSVERRRRHEAELAPRAAALAGT